ncbi:MAG: UDP-glucose/GDP-mannose dehydrogenase family protein [Coriobacteriia bacterium]|nr:UDP-glucose/GDP-mannose dehydrogenase family protein [Coriobacteriia bacterium]
MISSAVTVFGAGYVGLVTGACLASAGHRVTVVDVDRSKLARLAEGKAPFHEPGLDEIVSDAIATGALTFAHPSELTGFGEFIYVAVGTPSTPGGAADLRYVRSVIDQIASEAASGTVVIMKSTVPPGTGEMLSGTLADKGIEYVSNPEFLREGCAVRDWFETDRIVLGGSEGATRLVTGLYGNIDAPVVTCDIASAELIKYASNAFLATKISFVNEIARLCDSVGADVSVVARGVGLDSRIGAAFLNAGIGYGGSCFPKDTRALDFLASVNGYDFHLLKAVIDVNARQRLLPIIALRSRLGSLIGTRIAVFGLTFKPDTDDMRESPAADVIGMLLAEGAMVTGYDPVGTMADPTAGFVQAGTMAEAIEGAQAAIVATDWDQIVSADWDALVASMVEPRIVFDGRNCLDAVAVRASGALYLGVGRPQA